MSASVEDRLRDYTRRIDDAIDEYATRTATRTVPTAFLESPKPERRRAGGRRLVAAVAVCVIACATAGVVIAQRDPSRPSPHRPSPAASTAPQPTTSTAPQPTTSAVSSTTVTTAPSALSHAIDLTSGTLFGIAPGPNVDPDVVRATLTPILGPPTRDTGWYRTPSVNYDCLGGETQRILRWGSVSYAFWRESDAPQYILWGWTLGDSRAAGWGDRHEPQPIIERPAIPATTAAGIGIGTTVDALRRAFGSRFMIIGNGQPAQISRGPDATPIEVWLTNGKVAGIAGLLPFC